MRRWAGQLEIRTFVAGALSRFGHDLAFTVQAAVERNGPALLIEAQLGSLELQGAVQGDTVDATTLSGSDRRKIMTIVRQQVLHQGRYPDPAFAGELHLDSGVARVSGELSLHGISKPLTIGAPVEAWESGEVAILTLELAPSQWGIPPYSAMLGALKLQDRVRISGRVPLLPDAELGTPELERK
jgi:hypothetical protein